MIDTNSCLLSSFLYKAMEKKNQLSELGFIKIEQEDEKAVIGYYPLLSKKQIDKKTIKLVEKIFKLFQEPLLVVLKKNSSNSTWFYIESSTIKSVEDSEFLGGEHESNYKVISTIYKTKSPNVFIIEFDKDVEYKKQKNWFSKFCDLIH